MLPRENIPLIRLKSVSIVRQHCNGYVTCDYRNVAIKS